MPQMHPYFNDPNLWTPLPEFQLTPSGQPLPGPKMPLGGGGPLGTPLRNGPGGMPLLPQPGGTGGEAHNQQFGPMVPTGAPQGPGPDMSFSSPGGGVGGDFGGPGQMSFAGPGGGNGMGLPFGITGRDIAGVLTDFLPSPFKQIAAIINRATTPKAAPAPTPFSFDIGGSTLSLPSGSPMAGYDGATFGGQAVAPGTAEALAGGDMANALAQASQGGAFGGFGGPSADWNYGSGIPGDFAFSDPSMGGYDFGFSGGPGY